MDSAPKKTSSTPSPETNVVSELGGKTPPISSHAIRQIPEGIPLTSHAVVSQLAYPLPQRENLILTREGSTQASSQHGRDLFELRPLPSRKDSTKRKTSTKFPSSAADRTQKTKQHRPGGSSVRYTGAAQASKSRSGKSDVYMVERSIGFPYERLDKVASQRHQEKDKGGQKESRPKTQVIETKFRQQQRSLMGLYGRKKDHPIRLPTVPRSGCKGFQTAPTVQKQSPTKSMCEFSPGNNTAVPEAPALLAEPNVLEARESSENEWMEIGLEDADIALGQEEWEDDIVPASIPQGLAQNAWYLDMNA